MYRKYMYIYKYIEKYIESICIYSISRDEIYLEWTRYLIKRRYGIGLLHFTQSYILKYSLKSKAYHSVECARSEFTNINYLITN